MTQANGRGRKYFDFEKPSNSKAEARRLAEAAVASHAITKVRMGVRSKYRPMSTAPLDGRIVRLYPADGGDCVDGYFADGHWYAADDETTPIEDPCGWGPTNRVRQHRRPVDDPLTKAEQAGKWNEGKAGRDLRAAAPLNGRVAIEPEHDAVSRIEAAHFERRGFMDLRRDDGSERPKDEED